MRKVYICSPYRAKNEAEQDRNIEYAQELTKQALHANLAPITPHLYMTQCLNERRLEERAEGMAAGLELLGMCDFVVVGIKYGISKGMHREIQVADMLGIEVVNAEKLKCKLRHDREIAQRMAVEKVTDYAKQNCYHFCAERSLHNCACCDRRWTYEEAHNRDLRNLINE